MVMIIPFAPLFPVGAIVGIFGVSAITNIRQTVNLLKKFERRNFLEPYNDDNDNDDESSSILSCYLPQQPSAGSGPSPLPPTASAPVGKTTREVIRDLERMKREELLTLFLSCTAPTELTQIQGEWDGTLLENNGVVMTNVSALISNKLFGRGRTWNGKAFSAAKPEEPLASGINRFRSGDDPSVDSNGAITTNHSFDYSVSESVFGINRSVRLKYANYQALLSPWRTMNDEVRVLRMPSSSGSTEEDGGILIGVGWMAWSGGSLNCQPFCLIQSNRMGRKKNS